MVIRILAAVGLVGALVPSALGAEITVTMRGMEYRPARIQAAVGDTIRFVNGDSIPHAVFVPTGDHALDLGAQEPGQERVLTLRAPGRFEAECVFHPDMLLLVEVQ